MVVLNQQLLSFCSITAVRRMGLTVPPSLSNASPATHAVSPAWTGRSSPRCPCLRQNRLDPPSAPNMRGGSEVTAPPARPMIHPSTSAPPTRCTTAANASPTCPPTTRTRLWPCRCPPCTAPCWGTPSEADLRISTPTPEPSALRCNLADTPCTLTCRPWDVNRDLMVPARLSLWKHNHVYSEEGLNKPWSVRLELFLWSFTTFTLTEVTTTVDWRAAVQFWPLHAPVNPVNVDCCCVFTQWGLLFYEFPVKAAERKENRKFI